MCSKKKPESKKKSESKKWEPGHWTPSPGSLESILPLSFGGFWIALLIFHFLDMGG